MKHFFIIFLLFGIDFLVLGQTENHRIYCNNDKNLSIKPIDGGKQFYVFYKDKLLYPSPVENLAHIPTYPENVIELKVNGKYGLISSETGKWIVPPQYDCFFPKYDNRLTAYYKKGDTYGFIKKTSSLNDKDFAIYRKSPIENGTAGKWNFNLYFIFPVDDSTYFFYPSFICFYDIGLDYIDLASHIAHVDLDRSYLLLKNLEMRYAVNGVYAGWLHDDYIMDYYFYLTENNFQIVFDWSNMMAYDTLVNDTLLRIKEYVFSNFSEASSFIYFSFSGGKLRKIETDRDHPLTKYELLNMDILAQAGPYDLKEIDFPECECCVYPTLEQLDIMRNEIFAAHGYKFKTKKWQEYFSKKSWYKPRYDNVDNMLNPIEKKNAEFLLNLRKEYLKNPGACKKDTILVPVLP